MRVCRLLLPSLFVLLFQAIVASGAVLYVNVNHTGPSFPYAGWATAATNIQDAINAALPGDQILVTNGVYRFGGALAADGTTNRIAATRPVIITSVNGP